MKFMSDTHEYIGMARDEIDTPVLLVDLPALEANIHKLADHFRATSKNLRPHTKSHKTPAIAQLQLAAGAQGITCAKVGEARYINVVGTYGVASAQFYWGRMAGSLLLNCLVWRFAPFWEYFLKIA